MKNPRYANAAGGILIDYADDSGTLYVDQGGVNAALWQSAINGEFGTLAAFIEPPPPPPQIPSEVSPYQARVALYAAGLLPGVEALIADPETPEPVKIAWEYATTFQRGSAFIAALAPAMGLSEQQVDDLFIAAAQIT